MRSAELRGSFWPTPQQRLLLQVTLGGEGEAEQAWNRLRSEFDIERLEPGSYDLMPLLYRRLKELAPGDPPVAKLRGIYRRTWYTNQLELTRVTPALATLVESGVDPLVINGWELVFRYYRDSGLRPVAGLHVVVSPDRASQGTDALVDDGWELRQRSPSSLPRREFSLRLVRRGAECVVHRQLFHEFLVPADASAPLSLWEHAVDLTVGELQARTLAPADEFLNICLSGARARGWPNARWPADAAIVARSSGGELDWERVIEHARLLRATLRLREAMFYLRDTVPFLAPADVFADFDSMGGNRRERLAHAMSGWRGRRSGEAPESLSRYLRLTAHESVARAAARFPSFLRDEWGLRHVAYVPGVVMAKVVSRIVTPVAQVSRGARVRLTSHGRYPTARR